MTIAEIGKAVEMNSLTDEQRRRMEENRRKALEKRAAVFAASSSSGKPNLGSSVGVKPSNPPKGVPQRASSMSTAVSTSTTSKVPNAAAPQGIFNSTYKNSGSIKTSTWQTKNPGSYTSKGAQTKLPNNWGTGGNKVVTGTCRIISKDRFEVDCGYHAQLISILKEIPESRYG